MKIIHLEDFIHPDTGYQVNLLGRLQVRQGHTVEVVTGEIKKIPPELTAFFGRDDIEGRDARFERETGVKIHRVPLFGFYSGRAIFRPIKVIRKVLSLKPSVLFVHGEDTLTGIIFILISRWLPFPIVLDCHMLEMASMNKYREYFRSFYKTFITPIILKRKIPLIRVVDSDFVHKCLGIPLSHTDLLSLGTDTDLFRPDVEQRMKVRTELGLSQDSFLILYAGKLDETKGGKLLSEALQSKLEVKTGKKIEFLIIGNTVGEYGREVEAQFAESENKIVRLPTQRYFDLAKYYQAVDLAVYPKQCSMSFFEVQACGVPVLFEENEINDQRSQFGNAFLFKPNAVDEFRKKIIEISSMNTEQIAMIGNNARDYVVEIYDFLPIAQKYTDVLQRAFDKWNICKSVYSDGGK
jgi:glycosyltransferase involved in cell wall biosynthesis